MGLLRYFLRIEVTRSTKMTSPSQRKYALDLLQDVGYSGCKPANTPLDVKTKLSTSDGILLDDLTFYQRLVGKLIYLTITRPDLFYCCWSGQSIYTCPS